MFDSNQNIKTFKAHLTDSCMYRQINRDTGLELAINDIIVMGAGSISDKNATDTQSTLI
jgi:hypothetical protein